MGFFGSRQGVIGGAGFFGQPPAGLIANMTLTAAAGSIGGGGTLTAGYQGNNVNGPGIVGTMVSAYSGSLLGPPASVIWEGIGDASDAGPPFTGLARFVLSIFGAVPQNQFTSVKVLTAGGVVLATLLTASALGFDNGGGCGPNTKWVWATVGMVAGTNYGFLIQ
jgi:hypothetical protein